MYPRIYHDLFWMTSDGCTIRQFINEIESLAKDMDEEKANQFKGDTLEILSYLFFHAFECDERIGIKNYEPISLTEDYGVDGKGTNVNGQKVAIQVKYRSNPTDIITYADVARTFASGRLQLKLDLESYHTIYVFTTANNVSRQCRDVFGDRLVVIGREEIARLIDNNITFWKFAYQRIFEYLDDIRN